MTITGKWFLNCEIRNDNQPHCCTKLLPDIIYRNTVRDHHVVNMYSVGVISTSKAFLSESSECLTLFWGSRHKTWKTASLVVLNVSVFPKSSNNSCSHLSNANSHLQSQSSFSIGPTFTRCVCVRACNGIFFYLRCCSLHLDTLFTLFHSRVSFSRMFGLCVAKKVQHWNFLLPLTM